MNTLGVMLDATYALYGMEMNYVHRPAAGRDNCCRVKWTQDSLTRICWYASDENRVEFLTRIHLRQGMQLDERERFVELLNTVVPVCEDPLHFTRAARIEGDDLIVESCVVIHDATYVGEVEQAYLLALQEVLSIEAALA